MAYSEDLITGFSKSDNNVKIDHNLKLITLSLFLETMSLDQVAFVIDNTFSQTNKRYSKSDNIIIYIIALKWQKAANGGFLEFGSFQPYLDYRQLEWSTLRLIECLFLGYPTCVYFAHVVWWLRALWMARTTRRRRPGKSLTLGCIISVGTFANLDVI